MWLLALQQQGRQAQELLLQHQIHQLLQVAHRLELLNQQQHQLKQVFRMLEKEFRYQLCR